MGGIREVGCKGGGVLIILNTGKTFFKRTSVSVNFLFRCTSQFCLQVHDVRRMTSITRQRKPVPSVRATEDDYNFYDSRLNHLFGVTAIYIGEIVITLLLDLIC